MPTATEKYETHNLSALMLRQSQEAPERWLMMKAGARCQASLTHEVPLPSSPARLLNL